MYITSHPLLLQQLHSSLQRLDGFPRHKKFNFLVNLGEGAYLTAPYTFSSPDLDLAIISIDQRNSKFGDNLVSLGYEPINLDDFNEQTLSEGLEVFSIPMSFKESIKAEDLRELLSLQQEKERLANQLMMGIGLPIRKESLGVRVNGVLAPINDHLRYVLEAEDLLGQY